MRAYRFWVYLFNCTLIVLQLLFLHIFWLTCSNQRLRLFPLEKIEFLAVFTCVSISLQFFTCFCGIFGVYFSNRYFIRLYWFLMLPLIIFDTVQIISWAYAFANLHENYEAELSRLFENQLIASGMNDAQSACREWFFVQEEFSCCAPSIVLHNCRNLTAKCNLHSTANCHFSLLKWLHTRMDILAILLYFIIYPLKWLAVCVLKQDLNELFTEILFTDNHDLYRHWLVIEQQERDDSHQSSQLSSPNEYSLVSTNDGKGRNGALR